MLLVVSNATDASRAGSRPVPLWRTVTAMAVAIVGTIAMLVPAWFSFALASDYKNGTCRAAGIIRDTCDYTAVEGYGEALIMLFAPTVVGLLIARPRHVVKIVGVILTVALVAYLFLAFTGETVTPPPVEQHYGLIRSNGAA